MNAPWRDSALAAEIPALVATAFDGHSTLGMPATARVLEMDVKTLVRHCDARDIGFRYKGIGRKHRRRVFTLADVVAFLTRPATETAPCRSIATRARATGITTSRSSVALDEDRLVEGIRRVGGQMRCVLIALPHLEGGLAADGEDIKLAVQQDLIGPVDNDD